MTSKEEDWFTNVENLKPVRGGRRAATLDQVARNALHVSDKEAETKFRTDWELAKQSNDPLDILWHFSSWFDEHFPSGKPKLFYPMLYKICTHYGIDERYQHDERLLKFWILLAENFPERGLAVFDFAYNRGSCRTMAKFYVRWSEMYDTLGNSNKAREMLDFGLKNCAMPITVIHEARKRLEMRLMRDTLRQQKQTNLSDHEERDMDYEEEAYAPPVVQRKQLAKLKGVGEQHEAPMFRIPRGSAGSLRMPQTNLNASFQIYQDNPEVAEKSVVQTPTKTGRITDEFEDDPEYQALFGFFDYQSRVDIHLNISENLRGPTRRKVGLKDLPEMPVGDDFEIFNEEEGEASVNEAGDAPKRVALADKTAFKIKLCLRKDICRNETSPEELYASIVEKKRLVI